MTRKVLIVDDSKLARMAVIKALKSLRPDWMRLEAADAAAAVEVMRQEEPDVAVVDFNMPGKDGLTLAAELREAKPDIQLAVISANHQLEVVQRVRAMGAAFLPKPLTETAMADFLNGLSLRGVP